jgi:hypothetical protein
MEAAKREIAREHPEFKSTEITLDGPFPIKQNGLDFEVRLHYLSNAGGFLPLICQVHEMTGKVCNAPKPWKRARIEASPSCDSASPSSGQEEPKPCWA